jgi:hypothetical protein
MTPDEFVHHFKKWVTENAAKIYGNFMQKGGWEGWAQVELMNYLNAMGGTTIQREIPIYVNPKYSADLIVNFQDPVIEHQICIELKCESVFQSAYDGRQKKPNRIQDKVSVDLLRLKEQRHGRYIKSMALMLAIGFSEEAFKALSSPELGMVTETIKFDGNKLFIAFKPIIAL